MTEIRLRIGGSVFAGWKTLGVSLTMRGASAEFQFTASERFPEHPEGRRIQRGERAQVLFGDDVICAGWIDEVSPSYDSESHTVKVIGRDATADLVDCSAVPGQRNQISLERLVRDLAEPFGIPVKLDAPGGDLFDRFVVEPGETAWESIARAAGNRAVLPMSDGVGGLLITRVSQERTGVHLERGVNVESANANYTNRDRFSIYRVFGQQPGSDLYSDALEAAQVFAAATDPWIERYRPLDVILHEPEEIPLAYERALWEASTRRGAGLSLVLEVSGWDHPGGRWRPNTRIHFADDWLDINAELLIVDVVYRMDPGRRTTLLLQPPEAYEPIAIVQKFKKDGRTVGQRELGL